MVNDIKIFINRVFIWLVVGLYKIAANLFKVFMILADGNVIDSEDYEMFINNFYVVIGVVMLFVIAFQLLKLMVNPEDNKGTSTIKKMITNLITSTIILVLLPTIFTFMFDFQSSILTKQNVIGRFFGFGSSTTGLSSTDKVSQGAYMISNSVFTAFFNVADDVKSLAEMEEAQKKVTNDDGVSLYEAINEVSTNGKFRIYSGFAEGVVDDEIDFQWFLALAGGIALLYIAVTYSLDMGVRAVKLIFYQIIAPIPIMFRIVPEGKLSGSFNQWLKITLTCYMEVFTRMFALYFCIYLCVAINESDFFSTITSGYGFFLSLLSKACLFMGLITFMRQAPKLLSEVTGLDSGNMKLGIKDKLREGGAFTAGAIIGGGATAGVRNAVNRWKGKKNWQNKDGKVTAWSVARNAFGGLRSAAAGTVSAQFRAGKAGWKAGSFKDMKAAAESGAQGAVNAREKRSNYKASHGGAVGAVGGHFVDAWGGIKEWAGISLSASDVEGYYSRAANTSKDYNNAVEKTYKTKDAYIELDNKVKALKYRKNAGVASKKDLRELAREEAALKQMRIEESMKKIPILSRAAYELSREQKYNYSNDSEMVAEFESGLSDGFFDLKGSTVKSINYNQAAKSYDFVIDDGKGGTVQKSLDSNTYQIYDAMKNGLDFDEKLIDANNIIQVQDAIDSINRHRQDLNTHKAKEAFDAKQSKKKPESK